MSTRHSPLMLVVVALGVVTTPAVGRAQTADDPATSPPPVAADATPTATPAPAHAPAPQPLPADRSSADHPPSVSPPPTAPPPVAAATAVATVSQAPHQLAPPSAGARVPAHDPQADRVILLPTAYTHPKGTVFVSNYDIVLVQAGYAMTDQTQISMSAVPPLGDEGIAFFDLTLKTALAQSGLVRAAALGSVTGGVGNDIGTLFLGRIGGVVQLCMTANCGSGFTLSSNGVLAGPVLLMVNGVGGTWRVGRRVSLLAEVETLVPIGREGNQWNGAAVGAGVRFHFAHWGFDLALLRTARGKDALPLLTVTYRSAP